MEYSTFVKLAAEFFGTAILMIFGNGPFPELGVQGAALATVIARYIEALIEVIWAHLHRGKTR